MLSRKEKNILKILNDECGENKSCLIKNDKLKTMPSGSKKITDAELEKILAGLEEQNYLDSVKSKKQGEEINCITLHLKGKHYLLENSRAMLNLKYKVLFAVIGAVASFIVGKILFAVF